MPKVYSMEKIWREQEKKELIKALKPYPVAVTVRLEIDSIEFEARVPGAEAIRLFRRDPGMREAIRALEPGGKTVRISKTAKVTMQVLHRPTATPPTKELRTQQKTPYGLNPITGRPFSSQQECLEWVQENPELAKQVLEEMDKEKKK